MRRTSERLSGADTLGDDSGDRPEPVSFGLTVLFRPGQARPVLAIELGVEPVQIGRQVEPDRGIRLEDPNVSKRHVEVSWSCMRQRYWIRDLRSRNGTFLNGRRVGSGLLATGDLIRLGDTILEFRASPHEAVGWSAPPGSPMVGASPALRLALAQVASVAPSRAPVLVVGETGTGKELIADAIHQASRPGGPLRAVNCAALPAELVESELFGHEKGAFSGADISRAGLFRAAQGGTLFLDEVGELAPSVQAKLLRALDARAIRPVGSVAELPVDVRVVAATNRDLLTEVAAGSFRADLYARLAESVIAMPPLRERREDIEPLWRHFVAELGDGAVIDLRGATLEAMALYRWPFNAREMRQLARQALLRKPAGGTLLPTDLPPAMFAQNRTDLDPIPASNPDGPVLSGEAPSAHQLRQLVEEFRGNVKEVASFLDKDRTQVYRWLKRYGIDPGAYRSSK